jgi:ABC-2 type transport system ATP-binding protein
LQSPDVKTTGLSRVYETRKRKYGIGSQTISRINAVVDLELEIEPGELFGLLGPNGAGKTTTVKMLCTLLTPTRGNAWIRGLDVVKDANKVRKIVNMVAGGERMLYYRLTGRENLRYFAELYDVPSSQVRKRVQQVLDLVGLSDRADD